jgi:hypothetical protein
LEINLLVKNPISNFHRPSTYLNQVASYFLQRLTFCHSGGVRPLYEGYRRCKARAAWTYFGEMTKKNIRKDTWQLGLPDFPAPKIPEQPSPDSTNQQL